MIESTCGKCNDTDALLKRLPLGNGLEKERRHDFLEENVLSVKRECVLHGFKHLRMTYGQHSPFYVASYSCCFEASFSMVIVMSILSLEAKEAIFFFLITIRVLMLPSCFASENLNAQKRT